MHFISKLTLDSIYYEIRRFYFIYSTKHQTMLHILVTHTHEYRSHTKLRPFSMRSKEEMEKHVLHISQHISYPWSLLMAFSYVSPLDSSSSLVYVEFFSCMQNIRLVTSKLSYRIIFVVLVSCCFALRLWKQISNLNYSCVKYLNLVWTSVNQFEYFGEFYFWRKKKKQHWIIIIFYEIHVNKYCEPDQRTNQWFQKIKTIQKKLVENIGLAKHWMN